jgi:citrate synthase
MDTTPFRRGLEDVVVAETDVLGIPRSLFSAVFAAGRVAGWLAHVAEERAVDRLIRPRQRYVGPLPGGFDAGPSLRAVG